MPQKAPTELAITDLFKEYKRMRNYWQEHDEEVKRFMARHIELHQREMHRTYRLQAL